MKTTAFCPISYKRINEHVARLNGGFTLLLLVLFTFTSNVFPVILLLIDFSLRSGKLSRFSPIGYLSGKITGFLSLKPVLINSGPKIFAARIGLVFNLTIILSILLGLNNLALVVTGVFGTCAFLESVFGYCVACQFYPYVYKLTYHTTLQKTEI